MNNLHRNLAPISDAAWADIEQEASRTLRRYLAGRRVVDVPEARGVGFAAVDTGHTARINSPADGVQALQRKVLPLVELRVPFSLSRDAIDDVERGALDSDWQPLKDAAKKIAYAEDRAIFDGYAAAGIRGIGQDTSNGQFSLPASARDYPAIIADGLNELRISGVNGPYSIVLGARAFAAVSGGNEEGYPVLRHLERMIEGKIICAPAIEGAYILSTRGGDFELDIGQDVSIGYSSHSATAVELYLQESFTFRVLTTEASVVIKHAAA
ncbi:family 1 encapsulin nanocompartment shell protein [Komagataeibacter diospyri]|uniref:Linocin M18 bacteriocin protein n=1 Tax=Komagataeibacter diospyri TaxID=1932662 RepID=A0A4P5NRD3_9PROT|nr:family 1 encapsulin nanocompartment shell protein [Komagataeibacter diospyri]GCE82341.1 linocin M18 bacteriocin protein [Komagataeibacter diospyri]GCE88694.1 linocin M18 bacteriocin protein [Komagataeibacter diospyri]